MARRWSCQSMLDNNNQLQAESTSHSSHSGSKSENRERVGRRRHPPMHYHTASSEMIPRMLNTTIKKRSGSARERYVCLPLVRFEGGKRSRMMENVGNCWYAWTSKQPIPVRGFLCRSTFALPLLHANYPERCTMDTMEHAQESRSKGGHYNSVGRPSPVEQF
jgi:hypothetical protein